MRWHIEDLTNWWRGRSSGIQCVLTGWSMILAVASFVWALMHGGFIAWVVVGVIATVVLFVLGELFDD